MIWFTFEMFIQTVGFVFPACESLSYIIFGIVLKQNWRQELQFNIWLETCSVQKAVLFDTFVLVYNVNEVKHKTQSLNIKFNT